MKYNNYLITKEIVLSIKHTHICKQIYFKHLTPHKSLLVLKIDQ